jgi:hypothetical protein
LADFFRRSEKALNPTPICQLPFNEFHTRRQQVPSTVAKVVKNDGLMAFFQQRSGYGTTYIPSTPGD